MARPGRSNTSKSKKGGGDPCRTRTCDNLLRRQVLYPAELRGRGDPPGNHEGSMFGLRKAFHPQLGGQCVQGWVRLKRKLSEYETALRVASLGWITR